MKKVYQVKVDLKMGDCMQATVASLFELPLSEVPPFIELGNHWFSEMRKFYKSKGYRMGCFNPRAKDKGGIEFTKKVLEIDKGVNGYWCASVNSIYYKGVTHSVVIDSNMNVVHDPNPNNKDYAYSPEDVISFDTCAGDKWHIDISGNIIIDKEC